MRSVYLAFPVLALTLAACGGDDSIPIAQFDATPGDDAAMDASPASDSTTPRDGTTPDAGDAANEGADTGATDATTDASGASSDAGAPDSADGSDGGPADAAPPSDAGDAADGAGSCSDAGSFDISFGDCGVSSTNVPIASDGGEDWFIDSIVIQPSGKIVISGDATNQSDGFVMRILADGSAIDTSFASGGALSFQQGSSDTAVQLVQQADGKLLVATTCLASDDAAPHYDACVYRFTADGATDATYGSSGVARVSTAADEQDAVAVLALDAQGRALVGGYAGTILPYHNFIVRLTSAGLVDTSFNGGNPVDPGGVIVSSPIFWGIGALSTGRIAVASNNAVGFLTETGAPDKTINPSADGGASNFVPLPSEFEVHGLFVAPDDSTYVLGYQYVAQVGTRPSVVRLTSAGTFDGTFGNGGQMTYDSSFGVPLYAASLLGTSLYVTGSFAVGKIGSDGAPITTWGSGGTVQPLSGSSPLQIAASARGLVVAGGGPALLIARLLP